jgi:cytochrome P450
MANFQVGHETSSTALLWWSRLLAEPEAFRPERFLPDAEPPPRGAWMPFGAGPRVCIGQHFAMLEMTLVAAMLLQRYRLVLPDDAPMCVPELHVTFRPHGGVKLLLQRVIPPAAIHVAASASRH